MKLAKKVISLTLSVVLVLCCIPFSAFAAKSGDPATETLQEVNFNATNPLGAVIAKGVAESDEEKANNNGYGVFDVSINGLSATVNFSAPDNSSLVVAVYEEESMKMVSSGKARVNSDLSETVVVLSECDEPEYYVIKAFILDGDNAPVCNNYENRDNTKIMEEFFAKSVEDFDKEKVLNFDYSTQDNFAVISDDAAAVKQSDGNNILKTDDYENGIYVFENPDSEITSLQPGDVLYYTYGPGAEDYILTKIGTIENGEGIVTITASDDYEISDFFSYIDLDTAKLKNSPVAPAAFNEDKGEENKDKPFTEKSGKESYTGSGKYTLSIDLSAAITAHLSFRYDFHLFGADDYEFAHWIDVNANATIAFNITGAFSATHTLISADLPILTGLDIHFELKMTFKAEASFTATGSLTFTMKEGAKRTSKTGQELIREKPNLEYKVEVDGNFKIDIIPEIVVGFKILKVFFVDFDVTFDCIIAGELFVPTLTNGEENDEEKHVCNACLDGSVTIKITGDLTVKFGLKKDKATEIINAKGMLDKTIPLGDFYASIYLAGGGIEFGWGKCPHISYKTEITVHNKKNNPINNVVINCIKTKDEKGEAVNEAVSDIENTGNDGVTVIYLPNGTYEVNAVYDGVTSNTAEIIINNAPSSADILMPLKKIVTFIVNNTSGELLVDASITCTMVSDIYGNEKEKTVSGISNTDNAGASSIRLEQGSYTVKASSDNGTSETVSFTVDDIDDDRVEIVISESYEVTVFVKDLNGKAIGNAKVSCMHVSDENGKPVNSLLIAFGSADADGKATAKLKNGTYTVTATDSDGNSESVTFTVNGSAISETIVIETEKTVIDSGTCGDNLTWVLYEDGELVISGQGNMYNYPRDVPSWYLVLAKIRKVTIKEGVTSIGEGTFVSCSSLTSITIPDSVTSIGDYAFAGCSSLTSITIPDSVTSIGDYAFRICSSLKSIAIPNSVTSIGEYLLYDCKSLTSITIPSSVTSIGDNAFSGCKSLTNITIPDSVTSIGNSAFQNCSNLTSITIPNTVTSIANWTFSRCSSLSSITIPSSVTSIGEYAFESCINLASITIPDSVTSIDFAAFSGCYCLMSITIPSSVTSIGDSAFYACRSLTSISILGSVAFITSEMFSGCSSLTSITIPSSVTTIGWRAFYNCDTLATVYYTGTKVQWDAISVSLDNDCLKKANIIYNYSPAKAASLAVPAAAVLAGNSETLESAVIGNSYIMLIVKDEKAEDLLSSENLLYIDQKTAESETLTFEFELKEAYPDYKVIFGGEKPADAEPEPPEHEHELTETVTLPTCTKAGFKELRCTECSELLETEVIPALGHDMTKTEVIKAATETKTGTLRTSCSRCDYYVDSIIPLLPAAEITYIPGDVDMNGEITAADARLALRRAVNLEKYAEGSPEFMACDVDNDKTVTAGDARLILRAAVGLQKL